MPTFIITDIFKITDRGQVLSGYIIENKVIITGDNIVFVTNNDMYILKIIGVNKQKEDKHYGLLISFSDFDKIAQYQLKNKQLRVITELNNIKAEFKKSTFSETEHLTIFIDGKPLDEFINNFYPNQDYLGLVPTFLNWLDNKQEREVVWSRIEESKQIVPILMCPDDCDLWCTVVVADTEIIDDKVIWKRLGLDKTDSNGFTANKIGTTVEWFDKIQPIVFSFNDYNKCISAFKSILNQ
jgi:hypothetical protein